MLSKKRRFEIFKRDKFTCQYCGGKSPEKQLTIDHKIATSKGGSDEESNLVTACMECNLAKGNTPLNELQGITPSIRVNLEIEDELNIQRQSLNATWREVIAAGMAALTGKTHEPKKPVSITVETNLKKAVQHISSAWDIIKKNPF